MNLINVVTRHLKQYLVTVSALWHGCCSALSGRRHFDDVIKNFEVYKLNLEVYKCFMKPLIEWFDWSETLKYGINTYTVMNITIETLIAM